MDDKEHNSRWRDHTINWNHVPVPELIVIYVKRASEEMEVFPIKCGSLVYYRAGLAARQFLEKRRGGRIESIWVILPDQKHVVIDVEGFIKGSP